MFELYITVLLSGLVYVCWHPALAVSEGCIARTSCLAAIGFLTATLMVVHPAGWYCCVIHLCEASNEENKPFQDGVKTRL